MSKQSPSGVNVSDQYWELWNLVFIQHNRLENGSIEDLNSKHVDTGAGFERIVAVLQGQLSNYSTDLFQPIIKKIEKITSATYKDNPIPFQVISDHVRMLSFALADGALPSNEGCGQTGLATTAQCVRQAQGTLKEGFATHLQQSRATSEGKPERLRTGTNQCSV